MVIWRLAAHCFRLEFLASLLCCAAMCYVVAASFSWLFSVLACWMVQGGQVWGKVLCPEPSFAIVAGKFVYLVCALMAATIQCGKFECIECECLVVMNWIGGLNDRLWRRSNKVTWMVIRWKGTAGQTTSEGNAWNLPNPPFPSMRLEMQR